MRILVTGGAGFIGSHVVDAYVAAGHEVVVADDLSTGRRVNVNPKAEFLPVDITSPHLADLFAAQKFDIVNHHAAQVDVRRSVADPAADAAINIGGTLRLLELCRRHGVRGVVFISSGGAIYGDGVPVPTAEDAPTRPLSPYGIGKLAGEHYVDYYQTVHGMPATVLRYANVYGPRQDSSGEAGVVAIFCQRLLQGEPPTVFGDGEQTRDFVYVGDVATANVRALDLVNRLEPNAEGPAAFNIGTGTETTVNSLLSHLSHLSDRVITPSYAPARPGEQRRSAVDPTRARQYLDWKPTVQLSEGLARTLAWFEERYSRPADAEPSAVRSDGQDVQIVQNSTAP